MQCASTIGRKCQINVSKTIKPAGAAPRRPSRRATRARWRYSGFREWFNGARFGDGGGAVERTAGITSELRFPSGFRWGAATAAYQVEGDNTNAQWYRWEQQGRIASGDRCGPACDWWRQAERDFDLARSLGLNALRLSIEWSRIEPRPGEWSAAAVARYREMLSGLRERGIEPLVTLHHFTHPIWFEERGAFQAPDAVDRFARFAGFAAEQLGDLCDFWCTINEPNVYSVFAYQLGAHPPGRRGDLRAAVRVQATLARAHAAAYRAIHRVQPEARVGWAQHYNIFDPARPRHPLDRAVAALQDLAFNEFFPRALRGGRAPFPFSLLAGDLRDARGTCDFVGVNVYARDLVRFDPRRPAELFGRREVVPGAPHGDSGAVPSYGEAYPEGIARVVRRVATFGKPIYVTEHGVADASDRLRPWLIAVAARVMHQALTEGHDLRGYYHWTLVDNFEWNEGWSTRFGLAALDVATQARTLRPSGRLYGEIARANALTPEMARRYSCAGQVMPAQPD